MQSPEGLEDSPFQQMLEKIQKLVNSPIYLSLYFLFTSDEEDMYVIIEKSRGGRFLWNRNLGWIWAGWQLALLKKKILADYDQLFRSVFSNLKS